METGGGMETEAQAERGASGWGGWQEPEHEGPFLPPCFPPHSTADISYAQLFKKIKKGVSHQGAHLHV